MSKESHSKQMNVFQLTWPIFIEILLFMLLGNMDTIMLSKYSDGAVAAVGVSNQVISMANIMFGIISSGTAILIAQYLGAEKRKLASQVVGVSLMVNLIFGLILSLFMVFSGKYLLTLMNLPPAMIDNGIEYLSIVGGFIFIHAVLMTITAIVRSHGFTKISMFVVLGMNIINIIGDYISIFGPFGLPILGVKGVALATVLSKFIGLIFMSIFLLRNIEGTFRLKDMLTFPKDILRSLLKVGIPSAGEQISYNFSQFAVTYIITLIGVNSITTKIYVQNIVMFTFLFSVAIGQGTQILIGHLVGKNQKENAYKVCLKSLRIALIMSATLGLSFAVFSKSLLSLFTHDSAIISVGVSVFIIDAILEPGRTLNLVIINSLRAAGDVKFPVYVGILSMWGISVTLAYFLGIHLGLGLVGVWCAFAVDEWLRGIIMLWRWKSRKWEKMSLVKGPIED
jgi:putative MATE family efflux protein